MKRALVLGETGIESLGRQIALQMLVYRITPVLVGRTANKVSGDPQLRGAQFIAADLMDPEVSQKVLSKAGDLSTICYLVVAGGTHLEGPVAMHSAQDLEMLWRTVVHGPRELVGAFHAHTEHPWHLITIASTSALVVRANYEADYSQVQAARATFATGFNYELSQRQGSKNLVVFPGGMNTGMWSEKRKDLMDPAAVAAIIWRTARNQSTGLYGLAVWRGLDGKPNPKEHVFIM